MRVLSLDFGEKNIGVAISDPTQTLAQGLTILPNSDNILKDLSAIIKEYNIVTIVVGLPYNMNFTKGASADKVDVFIEMLRQNFSIPIETYDERLTTTMSEKLLIEAGASRKKRKKVIDKLAAQLILQSYLDLLKISQHTDNKEDADV